MAAVLHRQLDGLLGRANPFGWATYPLKQFRGSPKPTGSVRAGASVEATAALATANHATEQPPCLRPSTPIVHNQQRDATDRSADLPSEYRRRGSRNRHEPWTARLNAPARGALRAAGLAPVQRHGLKARRRPGLQSGRCISRRDVGNLALTVGAANGQTYPHRHRAVRNPKTARRVAPSHNVRFCQRLRPSINAR